MTRVRIDPVGRIWCDDTAITLEGLRSRLAELRTVGGTVWYCREAPSAGPAPEAMAVMRLIVEHRLPISMSTRGDFSDVVQPDGTVVPRVDRHTLS